MDKNNKKYINNKIGIIILNKINIHMVKEKYYYNNIIMINISIYMY